MDMKSIVDQMTEDDALRMFYHLAGRFGWAGTVFSREDVSIEWHGDDSALTDDEWQFVRGSRVWCKFTDHQCADGCDELRDIVSQCKQDLAEKVSAETEGK